LSPNTLYVAVETLSEGSYAVVREFRVLRNGKVIEGVTKTPLRKEHMQDLRNEAFVMSVISCPRVVERLQHVITLGEERRCVNIVPRPSFLLHTTTNSLELGMPRLGETLFQFVEDNAHMSSAWLGGQLFGVLACVCGGLAALQSGVGFRHRDMHAHNIMLQKLPKGSEAHVIYKSAQTPEKLLYAPKLIDFGFGYLRFLNQKHINSANPYKSKNPSSSFDLQYLLASMSGLFPTDKPFPVGGIADINTLIRAACQTRDKSLDSMYDNALHRITSEVDTEHTQFQPLHLLDALFFG
jgi:hypothetical protein